MESLARIDGIVVGILPAQVEAVLLSPISSISPYILMSITEKMKKYSLYVKVIKSLK
jgi:hypothetical protein